MNSKRSIHYDLFGVKLLSNSSWKVRCNWDALTYLGCMLTLTREYIAIIERTTTHTSTITAQPIMTP